GTTGLAPQALRRHAARGPRDREDREHRPRQQPVRLHRAAEWADRHLQRPGEWACGSLSADAGADRFGRRGDREGALAPAASCWRMTRPASYAGRMAARGSAARQYSTAATYREGIL